jgi:dTDP-4-dehydrorhamnose 3,5-epimerase
MKFRETTLNGVFVIEPQPFEDERGFFARVFCKNEFNKFGLEADFVQINHSHNIHKGTLRGIHYQMSPFVETKLVRCIRGKVFDVIVDIRKDSSTFLQYFSIELSSENMEMLYIPAGFAHGFQTLEPNSELLYHHTAFYAPGHEAAINYLDPALNIQWPLAVASISEKDKNHPFITNQFNGL